MFNDLFRHKKLIRPLLEKYMLDREKRVAWSFRWAVESLTVGLANDFMYGPIPATVIWAGGERKA